MSANDHKAAFKATLRVSDGAEGEEVTITWAQIMANVACIAPRFFLERHSTESLEGKLLMNAANDLAFLLVLKPFGLTYEQYLLPWTDAAVREDAGELQRAADKLDLLVLAADDASEKSQQLLALHHRIDQYYDAVIVWRREHFPRNSGPEIRVCTTKKAKKGTLMALDDAKAIWLGGNDEIQNFDINFERTIFTYFSLKLIEDIGIPLRRLENLYVLAVNEQIKKVKDTPLRNAFVTAWHNAPVEEDLYLCTYEELARWKVLVKYFKLLKERVYAYSDYAGSVQSHADKTMESDLAPATHNDDDPESEPATEILLREVEDLKGDEQYYPRDWFDYIMVQAGRRLNEEADDVWGQIYPWKSCNDCDRYDDLRMIQCDGYHAKKTWFHFGCAQISGDDIRDDERWVCRTCAATEEDLEQRHAARTTTASANTVRLADAQQESSLCLRKKASKAKASKAKASKAKASKAKPSSAKAPPARSVSKVVYTDDEDDQCTPIRSKRAIQRAYSRNLSSNLSKNLLFQESVREDMRKAFAELSRSPPEADDDNAAPAQRPKFKERILASRIATNPARAQEAAALPPKIRAAGYDVPPPGPPTRGVTASSNIPPASAHTVRIADFLKEGKVKAVPRLGNTRAVRLSPASSPVDRKRRKDGCEDDDEVEESAGKKTKFYE